MSLRREILVFRREDGGLDLLDPLLDRLLSLAPGEDPDDPALAGRLGPMLEGPVADALRERAWHARRQEPAVPEAPDVSQISAIELPDCVSDTWRHIEMYRRLAEDRAGGREVTVLRGFLREDAAVALAAQVQAADFASFETPVVTGSRAAWRVPWLEEPGLRALLGAVLGTDLPATMACNAWRLAPGERMRPHPDGRRYAATFAIGLNAGWTAADGGAIAFGDPCSEGFVVRERWLPHLGDLVLFRPRADGYHVVEPPTRRMRWTVSGWWVRSG